MTTEPCPIHSPTCICWSPLVTLRNKTEIQPYICVIFYSTVSYHVFIYQFSFLLDETCQRHSLPQVTLIAVWHSILIGLKYCKHCSLRLLMHPWYRASMAGSLNWAIYHIIQSLQRWVLMYTVFFLLRSKIWI